MSATEKFFRTVKDVVLLSADVQRLAADTKELRDNMTDIDRRVVRLETMVEIAGQASSNVKKLE